MLDIIVLAGSFWPNTVEGWASLITFIIGFIGAIVAIFPLVVSIVKKSKELMKNKEYFYSLKN